MDVSEVEQFLASGELRGVEYKQGGALSDTRRLAKIMRAMMAMSNKRDGGLVLVGVEDSGTVSGISSLDLSTWKADHLRDKVAAYAEPFIDFSLEILNVHGVEIVVLSVSEFEEVPVICKKSYEDSQNRNYPILRDGTIYVRSRRKPESIPVSTQTDMRELIDLATDKGIAKFSRQLKVRENSQTSPEAGLSLPRTLGDAAKFAAEVMRYI